VICGIVEGMNCPSIKWNHYFFKFYFSDTPRRLFQLHIVSWLLNIFGVFLILAGHEHYSIDVFVAFYLTSRLFLYYHTLANSRTLKQGDHKRAKIWFFIFYFCESNIDGIVPNEYEFILQKIHIVWAWRYLKNGIEYFSKVIPGKCKLSALNVHKRRKE
jgi:hypothetical protein